ncbi:hypothetical protein ABZ319_11840 [Nocardia sp. NPDC005978]|uniref:hypothetical protein n=1 Tax=Nocardia sp. NPDC005978 TaxID=3156725 RepID=UPI0033B4EE7D
MMGHSVRTSLLIAVACAAAGVSGVPAASADEPLSCVPAIGTLQILPPLPGLFLPLPTPGGLAEFDTLALAPAGMSFPPAIEFRDYTQGFNDYVDVVLRDGALYVRPRASNDPWRKVTTPGCLDGGIEAISVNGNMLVAIDARGWIYSLDNLLSGPLLWNWTHSYGGPIWLWPGMKIPGSESDSISSNRWALSHRMSGSFVDAAGYRHPLTAGLVQIVSLTGDGSRITYQDPWLPADLSYEIGGPVGGRFIGESLSVSGSVTVVMNRYGDIYSREYDLDLAGANHIPGRYTWQPQGDKPSAPNQLAERLDPRFAAISLPAADWRHQPKVPGEITSRLSIQDSGPAVEDRVLVVEGRSGGNTGFWSKPLYADSWQFTATGQPLQQALLPADPRVDQSALTLAPEVDLSFAGSLPAGWTLTLDHFDWAQTEHAVTLTSPSNRTYPVRLYTTDELRLLPRAPGLDDTPRGLESALDLRPANPFAPENTELADYIRTHLNNQQIYELKIQATRSRLYLETLNATLPRI